MRITKMVGAAGALIAAALVGGTLIGSALATDETTDTSGATTEATAYCDVFMDTLAAELGTTRDGLWSAGQAAANAAIDAAVEAGDLDEERAAALRERIAEADGSRCAWLGHGFARGFAQGAARGFAHGLLGGDVLEAAADALGIESAELIGQVREAGSLQALAEAQGASYDEVRAAILAAVESDLDAAVAEGMAQERADAALERVTTWLDEGGEVAGLHPGRGRFVPGGPWHRGGPWGGGDDAEGDGS